MPPARPAGSRPRRSPIPPPHPRSRPPRRAPRSGLSHAGARASRHRRFAGALTLSTVFLRRRRRRTARRLQRVADRSRSAPSARGLPQEFATLRDVAALRAAARRRPEPARQGRRHDALANHWGCGREPAQRRAALPDHCRIGEHDGLRLGLRRPLRRDQAVSIIYGLVFVAIFFILHLIVRFVLPQADPFLLPSRRSWRRSASPRSSASSRPWRWFRVSGCSLAPGSS